MRELNDQEMEQAQGGFADIEIDYRTVGVSVKALNEQRSKLTEVTQNTIPSKVNQSLPQQISPLNHVARTGLAVNKRAIR